MSKRGYSREFPIDAKTKRVKFDVDRVPPALYAAVKAKAMKAGISLRTLTLRLWKDWLAQ